MLTPQTHEGTTNAEALASASPVAAPPPPPSISVGSGSGVGYGSGGVAGGVVGKLVAPSYGFHGIHGKVVDPTGTQVSNAHVTATNQAGESHTAYSDSNGEFRMELDPGTYQVTVYVPGFKFLSQQGVTLDEAI